MSQALHKKFNFTDSKLKNVKKVQTYVFDFINFART